MVYSYYPGCTLSTTAAQMDRLARASAAVLGFELCELNNWQCCGAVYPMGADDIAAKMAAIRALDAAHKRGQALVTLCSACHHVLKRINDDMKKDAALRDAAHKFWNDDMGNPVGEAKIDYVGETEVLHFLEVVMRHIGADRLKEAAAGRLKGRKIGAYYGCLLLRPSPIMQFDDPENPRIFEDFLAALGATPIVYSMRNECCGGYLSLKEPGRAGQMCAGIIENAAAAGAQELIVACPLCQYNIMKKTESALPVKYFTEILAEALGLEGDYA